jgi:hypothetical protein
MVVRETPGVVSFLPVWPESDAGNLRRTYVFSISGFFSSSSKGCHLSSPFSCRTETASSWLASSPCFADEPKYHDKDPIYDEAHVPA